MDITKLSAAQLRQAAELKDKIASVQSELNRLLGTSSNSAPVKKQRRPMSAAARAKLAAFQKARWAKIKAAKK
jgi:hypothetical protein